MKVIERLRPRQKKNDTMPSTESIFIMGRVHSLSPPSEFTATLPQNGPLGKTSVKLIVGPGCSIWKRTIIGLHEAQVDDTFFATGHKTVTGAFTVDRIWFNIVSFYGSVSAAVAEKGRFSLLLNNGNMTYLCYWTSETAFDGAIDSGDKIKNGMRLQVIGTYREADGFIVATRIF